MPSSVPLTPCASLSSRSLPSSTRRSASTAPGSSTSWAIDSAVTDLPDPDSPTMPTASPRPIVNETPRTGRIGPPAPGNVTRRGCAHQARRRRRSRRSPTPRCAVAATGHAASNGTGDPRPGDAEALCAIDSPSRLNASPAITTAMPGAIAAARVGVDLRDRPSCIRRPQSYAGGWTPRPRNDSPGEGEQRATGTDRGIHDQRLADVRQDVPYEQLCGRPTPAMRAAETKSRSTMPATSVWRSRANDGCPGQADGQDRPDGAGAEDDREEQGEQKSREGDRDVDARR